MTQSPDRRLQKRVPAEIAVELRDGKGFSLHASRNLSAGGVYFDRSIPFPVGSLLDVSFTLPGEATPIACRGEVVNVPDAKNFGMGVRFLELSSADRQRLDAFTASLEAP